SVRAHGGKEASGSCESERDFLGMATSCNGSRACVQPWGDQHLRRRRPWESANGIQGRKSTAFALVPHPLPARPDAGSRSGATCPASVPEAGGSPASTPTKSGLAVTSISAVVDCRVNAPAAVTVKELGGRVAAPAEIVSAAVSPANTAAGTNEARNPVGRPAADSSSISGTAADVAVRSTYSAEPPTSMVRLAGSMEMEKSPAAAQPGSRKAPMRVAMPFAMYSVVYQNVQSSEGSTCMAE